MFSQKYSYRSCSFYLSLCALSTLLGCSSDDGKEAKTPSPTGASAYVQLSQLSDTDSAVALTRLYQSGRKITLVGGDLLVAKHNGIETPLFGNQSNGVYGGSIPQVNNALAADFSIQYLPKQARQGRWYPSDQAYVDKGAGVYVGAFSWSTHFLDVKVSLPSPISGQVYNYSTDLVTIQWQVSGVQTGAVDVLRLMAFHECNGDVIQLDEVTGANKLSGTKTITISELFDGESGNNFTKLSRSLIRQINGNPARNYSSPRQCDVSIYAIAEDQSALPAPFTAGDSISSVHQVSRIRFDNLGQDNPIGGIRISL